MIKKTKFYFKMLTKIVTGRIINNQDIMNSYNNIASTYNIWIEKMGKNTDKILKSEDIEINSSKTILDLACGSGYITKEISKINNECKIISVDISKEMLKGLSIINDNITTVNMDGIKFLRDNNIKFDYIFCGWALPYFNHKELLPLITKSLKRNGLVAIISNSKGTLNNIEKTFLNVMKKNINNIQKPMLVSYNLPNGIKGLESWLLKFGLHPVETFEGEDVFEFDKKEKLLEWLEKTGALAGTGYIFKDYESIRSMILDELNILRNTDGKYTINHKYVGGIFKLL